MVFIFCVLAGIRSCFDFGWKALQESHGWAAEPETQPVKLGPKSQLVRWKLQPSSLDASDSLQVAVLYCSNELFYRGVEQFLPLRWVFLEHF